MSEERQLIARCKDGDIEAYEQLIQGYQKKVYNIALKMLGNAEDASDAAQEALIKVYKSIAGFKEESSLSTWIYRIATNVCLDELRKKKKSNVVSIHTNLQTEDGELSVQIEDHRPQPDQVYENLELRQEMKKAIDALNEEHKTVVVLRDIQGMSYEEIAHIMQCSLGTVKSRINRARNTLKNILLKKQELLNKKSV